MSISEAPDAFAAELMDGSTADVRRVVVALRGGWLEIRSETGLSLGAWQRGCA